MSLTDGDKISQDRARRLQQSIPSSYTIWKDGTQAKAECNLKGGIDYLTGTDSAVIQAALNGLSAGRTWKEKVLLKGNFELSSYLNLPSYTVLETVGKLKMASAAGNTGLITIELGTTDIDIIGGELDGNSANQTANLDNWGIYFGGLGAGAIPKRITIQNLYVKNCLWAGIVGTADDLLIDNVKTYNVGALSNTVDPPHSIYLDYCTDVVIREWISDSDTGFKISHSHGVTVKNPIITNTVQNTGTQVIAVVLMQYIYDIKLLNPTINTTLNVDGIRVDLQNASYYPTDIKIINPDIQNVGEHAIYCDVGNVGAERWEIRGGRIFNVGGSGVRWIRVNDSEILGLKIEDFNQDIAGYPAIRLGASFHDRVGFCYADGNAKGLAETDLSDYNIIALNDFYNATGAPKYDIIGANTIDQHNMV
jgi:hypothetical protein